MLVRANAKPAGTVKSEFVLPVWPARFAFARTSMACEKSAATTYAGTAARQRERKITGPTAKIEHACIPSLHDWPQAAAQSWRATRDPVAGTANDSGIVARCDLREHRADFSRSVRFGLRAFWASPLRGRGRFSHSPCRNHRRIAGQSARRSRQPTRKRHRTMLPCRDAASAQIAASVARLLSERIAAIRLFAGTRGHGGSGPILRDESDNPADVIRPCDADFASEQRGPPSCPKPPLRRAGNACSA